MRTVVVTGAYGFIGRNLLAWLGGRDDLSLVRIGSQDSEDSLRAAVEHADVIVHLAGANRPVTADGFVSTNVHFTDKLCSFVRESRRTPRFIFASSIHAAGQSPYGQSKLQAERILERLHDAGSATVSILRLKNVFGKWCRPHYNSVVATFCHSIARDEPIELSDPGRRLELVHVDDVASTLASEIDRNQSHEELRRLGEDMPSYGLTLSDLAGKIQSFQAMRETLMTPDFTERFNQQLYSTFLSYVEPSRWEYGLRGRHDNRGSLAEFMKSPAFGQVFVSHTLPGVTRGNHYHHVKTEKFLVLSGHATIRLRHIEQRHVREYHVAGEEYRVVDVPPGHTHSITNTGSDTLVTLFWASEMFDPDHPDTFFLPVDAPNDAATTTEVSSAA